MNSENKVIYIPAYVEQGVAKLQEAKTILEEISAEIESGVSTINGSGYNRGIPYIEKGDTAANTLEQMKSTIATITSEIEKYSSGKAPELESAIIIADPDTASQYGLTKEQIDMSLTEYLFQTNGGISPKWASGYLIASKGFIKYTAADGRLQKETWCDLNPNNLVKLMKESHGIELDYWIREDGVYMYGDYVMVAADIPHMDGTQQAAEYRKGDLVETSLGTGIVVDLCGMAGKVRRGELKGGADGDVEVWYDIYTAWHEPGYSSIGYNDDGSGNATYGQAKMLDKAENPYDTSKLPRKGTPLGTQGLFQSNGGKKEENTEAPTTETPKTDVPITNPPTSITQPPTSTPPTPITTSPPVQQTQPVTIPNGGSNGGSTGGNNGGSTGGNNGGGYTPPATSAPTTSAPVTTPATQPPTTQPPTTAPITQPTTTPIYEEPITNPPTQPIVDEFTDSVGTTINGITGTTEPTEPITQPVTEVPTMPTTEIPTVIIGQEQNPYEDYEYQDNTTTKPTITTTDTTKKFNPIPIIAGVGVVAAAGVGVKMYADSKKKEEGNEYTYTEDDEEIEEI